jgi:hypothetical protein
VPKQDALYIHPTPRTQSLLVVLQMPRRLALELYHTIIHDVNDTNDLLSLALCCSAFRGEAQRFLFRHADPKSLGQRTQLISTINASPLRLGPLVHTFYIRHELGSDEVNYLDEDDHVVSLSSALRAMYNLKHLRNEGVQMTLTVLQGCIFKLHTLVWNCSLDKSKMLFLLCDFLPAQHSIKHLQFCHMAKAGIIEVPANLCPNLNSLGAIDEFTIKALLRDNRLITRFQWHGSGAVPRMSIRQLNRLEYLRCGMNELNINPSFTLHLTSLVFLEVPINIVATLILSFQVS